MKFNRLTVRSRLAAGFGVVIALLMVISALALVRMSQIEGRLDEIVDVNMRKMALLEDMSHSVHVVQRVIRTLILLHDPAAIDREAEKISVARKKYDDAFAALEKTPGSETGMTLRRKTHEVQDMVRPLNGQIMELARAGKDAEATELLVKKGIAANQQWLDLPEENVELQEKATAKEAAEARSAYESARTTTVALALLAVACAIGAGLMITRSLTRQLGGEPSYAAEVADRIAAGDLSIPVHVRAGDQSSMLYAMKKMRDSLSEIVAEVRAGTQTMASAASQIASGNLDLSSRTEEEASSLEETASSMEELTSTVKQNADNARQANALATTASEVATQGGQVVATMVTTMGAIHEASTKIVDIIAVIDGIAFQTNILALNAAVEAARAGEQGRGFAVVAAEVRTLAQRSANAAKEIKQLIDNSVQQVAAGSAQVDRAGETMAQVVESVKRVTDIISEISAASAEQTSGIEQINQAITQMDEVTQQNASLVEEAAAASEALQEQAHKLADMVSIFKLDSSAVATSSTARTPAQSAISGKPATRKPAPLKVASRATPTTTDAAPLRMVQGARAAASGTDGADWTKF